MGKYSTPRDILNALGELSDKQRQVLESRYRYPVNDVKRDIYYHFNRLVTEKDDDEKAAKETLKQQFDDFLSELETAAEKVKDGTKAKDIKKAKLNYQSLKDAEVNAESNAEILERLGEARVNFSKAYKEASKLKKVDSERLLYDYLTDERDILAGAADERIGDSKVFQFAHKSVVGAIQKQTYSPGKEGAKIFQTLHNLREKVGLALERPELRRADGEIRGIYPIIELLEDKLFEKGIGDQTLDRLDLPFLFADRFYKLTRDKSISLDDDEIEALADQAVNIIQNSKNKMEAGDHIAKLVFDKAAFDRTDALKRDFKERLGKKPVERGEGKENNNRVLGKHGMAVAGVGLALSAAGGIVKRTSDRDAVEAGAANTEEAKSKARKRQNRKLVFASVASIAATALIVDGLLFKGKYTLEVLNRMRGKGGNSGQSLF